MNGIHKLAAALAAVMWAGAAAAHTPYVKPDQFRVEDRGPVEANTAYSTSIFTPTVGMSAEGVALFDPDGQRIGYASVTVGESDTTLVANLPRDGTYRLSTGEHLGEISRMVLDQGRWRAVAPGERLRRGARTSTMQTVALAEAYVSRGAPSRGAVDMTIGQLAIRPVTHPNEITVSGGFDLDLLFHDAPFAFMPFVLYPPGQSEDDMSRVFVTDEHGRAHIRFDQPGVYLAVVRYRTPAPRQGRAQVLSFSTSITFEVKPDPAPEPEWE